MKCRILLFILLLAANLGLCAEDLVWGTDYNAALVDARQQGFPVLLDFSASWCTYCRMMEETTFKDDSMKAALANHVMVKIDFDRNPDLVARYHVHGVPAFFLLNQFGETVSTSVGYLDADKFGDWLRQNEAKAFASVSQAQAAEQRLAELSEGLGSTDPVVWHACVGKLLDAYVAHENLGPVDVVGKNIRTAVQLNGAEMVGYLNDARLAVRILMSNLFAEKLGKAFVFDPWADEATRAPLVKEWAEKVAARDGAGGGENGAAPDATH